MKKFEATIKTLSIKSDKDGFKTAVPTFLVTCSMDECRHLFEARIADLAFGSGMTAEGAFTYRTIKPRVIWGVQEFKMPEDKSMFKSAPVIDRIEASDNQEVKIYLKCPFSSDEYRDAFVFVSSNLGETVKLEMKAAPIDPVNADKQISKAVDKVRELIGKNDGTTITTN